MPRPARLLIDPPAAGRWNMAVDEALLQTVGVDQTPTLRLYRWKEPTLSLGYFQRAADRQLHPASTPCRMIRRPSGGGAIVHDCELTYSYVTPLAGRDSTKAANLYGVFHETLIATLAQLGVMAQSVETSDRRPPSEQPFLCFQRRSAGDVLVAESKVVGSAQRRRTHGMLQHGSILLHRSHHAPELPGITDLADSPFPEERLIDLWLPQLGGRLGVDFTPGSLSRQQRAAADSLAVNKFGHDAWTLKR